MKKILIFALLLVFAAFPAFSQATVGGELDYYMINGFDDDDFEGTLDKAEINFNIDLGDYNSVSTEIEARMGTVNETPFSTKPAIHMNYAVVGTDWAMMFGLEGFTIATTVGFESFETFDNVDFTGYNYENADNPGNLATGTGPGFKVDLGFLDGLIQPYFAMAFNTQQAGASVATATEGASPSWFVGSGFDFNGLLNIPIWLEVYYGTTENSDAFKEKNNQFGIEVAYNLTTAGGMMFDIGGFFKLDNQDSNGKASGGDTTNSTYGAGVGVDIAGVGLGVSFMGHIGDSYGNGKDNSGKYIKANRAAPFSVLGVDAEYFFLEWLGVNAGATFSFVKNTEIFQGFEVGAVILANEDITYKLGYMYTATKVIINDKATGSGRNPDTRTLNTDGTMNNDNGGIYFAANIDF